MDLPKDGNVHEWILNNLATPGVDLIKQVRLMWQVLDEVRTDMGLSVTDVPFRIGMAQINYKSGRESIAYRLVFEFPQKEEVAFFLILNENNKIVQVMFQGGDLNEGATPTLN